MPQFQFAQNAFLTEMLQTLIPELTFKDPFFQLMPMLSIREQTVLIDQESSFYGATQGRGYDTGFGQVAREERLRVPVPVGLYGEEKPMGEQFIMTTRKPGTFGEVYDLYEAQASDQKNLIDRTVKLILSTGWGLFSSGTYTTTDPKGATVATDSYNLLTFTVATAWSNAAASTPMADLRALKLKHRGQSASFGRGAKLFMNSQDVNDLLANTNANDLGAKRVITVNAGAQPFTLADVNRYLLEADLPEIVEYDKFLPTSSANFNTGPANFNMYIPYQAPVLIGARDMGDPVGNLVMTPTFGSMLQNRDNSVPDARTSDDPWSNIYFDFRLDEVNWKGISRIAFNLAYKIDFPSAIVRMNTN